MRLSSASSSAASLSDWQPRSLSADRPAWKLSRNEARQRQQTFDSWHRSDDLGDRFRRHKAACRIPPVSESAMRGHNHRFRRGSVKVNYSNPGEFSWPYRLVCAFGRSHSRELFSVERLEQHAESLAAAQRVPKPTPADGIAAALRQHPGPDRRLSRDRQATRRASGDHAGGRMAARQFSCRGRADPRDQGRSAAWLLSHAAEAGGRTAGGVSACLRNRLGVRRPYRQRVRLEKLTRFVAAYQRVQPLTIGELWAVAITLRIMLVENLRRLAEADRARVSTQAGWPTRWRTGSWERQSRARKPPAAVLQSLDQAPWSDRIRRPTGPAVARSGSQSHAGAALAERTGWQRRERPPMRSCARSP